MEWLTPFLLFDFPGPPSAPRHLNFSLVGTQISLWWQPPLDRGGRQDLTYNVACQICHFLVCEPCESSVTFSPSALGLLKPSVVVDGLEAYTNYSFTVRAHNGVSGLSLASHNSTSSPVWVSVGHAGELLQWVRRKDVAPSGSEQPKL